MSLRKLVVLDGALGDLLKALRELHVAAGEPTVRDIASLTNGQISRDTVHRVLTAGKVPRWRNVEFVVRALDGDVTRFQHLWTAARLEENTSVVDST